MGLAASAGVWLGRLCSTARRDDVILPEKYCSGRPRGYTFQASPGQKLYHGQFIGGHREGGDGERHSVTLESLGVQPLFRGVAPLAPSHPSSKVEDVTLITSVGGKPAAAGHHPGISGPHQASIQVKPREGPERKRNLFTSLIFSPCYLLIHTETPCHMATQRQHCITWYLPKKLHNHRVTGSAENEGANRGLSTWDIFGSP